MRINLFKGLALNVSFSFGALFSAVFVALALHLLSKLLIKDPFSGNQPLVPFVLAAVVIGPLLEELVFRFGLFDIALLQMIPEIMQKFWKRIGRKQWVASCLILQALIFGFLHSRATYQLNLIISLGGLLYGILYLKFGKNLFPAYVAHATFNLLPLIL